MKGDRDCYEIDVTPKEGITGKPFATDIMEPNHVFTGLVPGTEYQVTVKSVSNGRTSEELVGFVATSKKIRFTPSQIKKTMTFVLVV